MYKDKDKQKEAVRLATRRYRAKGITKVSREQGITEPIGRVSQDLMDDFAVPAPIQHYYKPLKAGKPTVVKQQSYNPMMVGYVPPKD